MRPIGDGGMASVWQARDELSGRDVAVKIVPATRDDELFANAFVRGCVCIARRG